MKNPTLEQIIAIHSEFLGDKHSGDDRELYVEEMAKYLKKHMDYEDRIALALCLLNAK